MIRLTRLPNGLRVVSETIPHVGSASIGIWVQAGSRHEHDEEAGLSHFLEHLMFKGTERLGPRELAEAMDAIGGHFNAYTTKEYTCYEARILVRHLGEALDLLADMLLHPRLAPEDIEREKGVIGEEIKMYEDTPDELAHDLLLRCVWPGDPLGRPVLGSLASIAALDPARVRAFYERHYDPTRAVVAAAGGIEHERLVDEVARRFGEWSPRQGVPQATGAPVGAAGCERRVRLKDVEQVHLCLGVPGASLADPDLYPLMCLTNVLGGGASSRLFQQVREERGLAYAVYAFELAFRDTGLFGVYAGTSVESAAALFDVILGEMERFRRAGPRPGELSRTKEQLKTSLALSLESTGYRMSRLGRYELVLGRVIDPDEELRALDAVDEDDVMRLAEALLVPERMAVAAVSPVAQPFDDRLSLCVTDT